MTDTQAPESAPAFTPPPHSSADLRRRLEVAKTRRAELDEQRGTLNLASLTADAASRDDLTAQLAALDTEITAVDHAVEMLPAMIQAAKEREFQARVTPHRERWDAANAKAHAAIDAEAAQAPQVYLHLALLLDALRTNQALHQDRCAAIASVLTQAGQKVDNIAPVAGLKLAPVPQFITELIASEELRRQLDRTLNEWRPAAPQAASTLHGMVSECKYPEPRRPAA